MINLKDGLYVVELPEHQLYQPHNPDTGQPFTCEADAKAWEDAYLVLAARIAADTAAAAQAHLAALLHLEIVADHAEVAVGTAINVTAMIKNGLGATVPLDQAFAVPIENSAGQVEMIKGVTFAAGNANVSITFLRSGYFRITEAGINRKLNGMHIGLPAPFEVTVFE